MIPKPRIGGNRKFFLDGHLLGTMFLHKPYNCFRKCGMAYCVDVRKHWMNFGYTSWDSKFPNRIPCQPTKYVLSARPQVVDRTHKPGTIIVETIAEGRIQ